MLNGVMVALQILVLSVWVRVLVEQQNETFESLFFYSLLHISEKSSTFAAAKVGTDLWIEFVIFAS